MIFNRRLLVSLLVVFSLMIVIPVFTSCTKCDRYCMEGRTKVCFDQGYEKGKQEAQANCEKEIQRLTNDYEKKLQDEYQRGYDKGYNEGLRNCPDKSCKCSECCYECNCGWQGGGGGGYGNYQQGYNDGRNSVCNSCPNCPTCRYYYGSETQ